MRAFETEKTEVAEIDRSVYDIRTRSTRRLRSTPALTAEIVEKISEEKHDPEWMREFRLKALDIYNKASIPNWGPSLEGLDMSNIVTYVRPNTEMRGKWSDVPRISRTRLSLGIPQAERSSLAGVGAQYDPRSSITTSRRKSPPRVLVYTDMESALTGPYADMVKEHFMKCVPPTDHKFGAARRCVERRFLRLRPGGAWTFRCSPLLPPERPGAGQFDTLIIVDEGAYLHFIEGCSAPKYKTRCQPARRLRRDFRRRGCPRALLDHRELVEEYVQSEH